MRGFKKSLPFLTGLVFFFILCGETRATDWIPLTGAFHVHTVEFSSGAHTLNELADMARKRGVDVIVLTDHDQIAVSYGIPPFRNLFSLTRSRNSVRKQGAREYLEAVRKAGEENPDVLLVPGLESAPFYYWSGAFLKGTLTAHNWRKHIHVAGLSDPKDIEGLPVLYNGFSMRYFFRLLPRFLVFAGVVLLSIVLIQWGGAFRTAGRVFLVLGLLGAFDAHPFKSSLFDPYHGDQGTDPYQEVINYVESRGGMTFWAHPEAHYGAQEVGLNRSIGGISLPKVHMRTDIHPYDLVQTEDYTGFEALYGDTIHATDPGKEWDRVLLAYCNGTRAKPAWGLCGLDFHRQGQNSWSELDRGQTIFWVREKTQAAVLDAMRNGRMYAAFQGGETRIRLDSFLLCRETGTGAAVSGETIQTGGNSLRIRLEISLYDGSSIPVKVDLIDSGEVMATLDARTPVRISKSFLGTREKGYVRAMVRAKRYRIVTNPIFYENP